MVNLAKLGMNTLINLKRKKMTTRTIQQKIRSKAALKLNMPMSHLETWMLCIMLRSHIQSMADAAKEIVSCIAVDTVAVKRKEKN